MPKFQQRHYVFVASVINETEGDSATIKRVAENLADSFSYDNPNFKREKFLEMCGHGE